MVIETVHNHSLVQFFVLSSQYIGTYFNACDTEVPIFFVTSPEDRLCKQIEK
jgi:hypothetical protein